jgi:hypothetical protein
MKGIRRRRGCRKKKEQQRFYKDRERKIEILRLWGKETLLRKRF